MKFTHLIAAGLMVAGLGVTATAASAQDYRGDRGHGPRYDRRDDRRDDRNHGRLYRGDRGRHYGWNNRGRNCRVEWRHHRRVTVCYR